MRVIVVSFLCLADNAGAFERHGDNEDSKQAETHAEPVGSSETRAEGTIAQGTLSRYSRCRRLLLALLNSDLDSCRYCQPNGPSDLADGVDHCTTECLVLLWQAVCVEKHQAWEESVGSEYTETHRRESVSPVRDVIRDRHSEEQGGDRDACGAPDEDIVYFDPC